jgi:hypothetical protein
MSSTHSHDRWTELASAANEGLEVSLLRSKSSDRVKVAIADTTLDRRFEFDVTGADALTAFYHQFAYAPDLGSGGAIRESLASRRSAAW